MIEIYIYLSLTAFHLLRYETLAFKFGLTITGRKFLLSQIRKGLKMEELMQETDNLYTLSSQIRAIARMFAGDGSDRPDITLNWVECDGLAFALVGIADRIDEARDRL